MQDSKSARHFHLLRNQYVVVAPVPPGAVGNVLIWIIYSSIFLPFQQHLLACSFGFVRSPFLFPLYYSCIQILTFSYFLRQYLSNVTSVYLSS